MLLFYAEDYIKNKIKYFILLFTFLFVWPFTIIIFAQNRFIEGMTYIKQENRNYCGPAALAMLINYWSKERPYTQAEIVGEIFDKKSKMVYNSDMVYYPNKKGFISYSFNIDLPKMKEMIDHGIPLIVFQKAAKVVGKGHYRVVFGYNDEKGVIILHDPLIGDNRGMKYRDFMKLWVVGNDPNRKNWAMALFPPQDNSCFPELRETYIFHVNMATAYYRRASYNESIAEWQKAILKSRNNPLPYYCLAQVLIDINEYDEAIRRALEAVEIDNENSFAYDVLGLAYYEKGMYTEAAKAMEKAAKLSKKEHGFIQKHWLKIRDKYLNNYKKKKNSK